MKEKKEPNILQETAKAVVRGGARAGGTLGTPFRAVQTGINSAKGIKQGFDVYNKKTAPKPVKPAKPTPAVAKPKTTTSPTKPTKPTKPTPKPKATPKPVAKPKKK